MTPSAQVEAILFQQAEPVALSRLAKLLNWDLNQVNAALEQLTLDLQNRGLSLIKNGEEVVLGTAPAAGEMLANLAKQELAGPVGKAGLETLAIILYHAPISRPEVDYIRGVNSSFIIRHLLVRGLIKRSLKDGNARTYVYEPTTDLLANLGVTERAALPRYDEITKLVNESLETINQTND